MEAAVDAVTPKSGFRLLHPLRVRWAEIDAQNIVFNAHYLAYFDLGITEYWRTLGLPYPDMVQGTGGDLFVVKSVINYHTPARYDDMLDVAMRAARIGNASLSFEAAIFRGDERLVSGELVYVFACPEQRKSQPLPQTLRQAIAAYEGSAAT